MPHHVGGDLVKTRMFGPYLRILGSVLKQFAIAVNPLAHLALVVPGDYGGIQLFRASSLDVGEQPLFPPNVGVDDFEKIHRDTLP